MHQAKANPAANDRTNPISVFIAIDYENHIHRLRSLNGCTIQLIG